MSQAAFARALLSPDAPLPAGVVGPDGLPDTKRFAVYRNNVTASLTRALEAAFPMVRQLVGDAFFGAMAVEFLRAHLPRQRQLMLYGEDFPAFLETFPPVAPLGYLPDVARLEQALRISYHAADSTPLPPEDLARLPEAELLQSHIHLAPSLRLLRSGWPVHGIWAAHAKAAPVPQMQAEDCVILRPAFDPEPHILPPGGAGFLAALLAGSPLGAALAGVPEGFDLAHSLGMLLQGRAIVGVNP